MPENIFMAKAIKKAWKYQLLTYPNPAVGATIVKDGKIIASKAHQKAGKSHAELRAIKKAYIKLGGDKKIKKITSATLLHSYLIKHHNNMFCSCEIYTTLEPCSHIGKTPSCAALLSKLMFKKVFIGSIDTNNIAKDGINIIKKANIAIQTGVMKSSCDKLLLPFKIWQKHNGGFCFFKLAMRADGSINHGQISSPQAQRWVHQLRSTIDLLVIGGKTVRTDRPILDTREFKKSLKNPDVMIYSHQKYFDKDIKLFKIKDREVYISNKLPSYIKNKYVMIEGGFDMLKASKSCIDMLVLVVSTTTTLSVKYQRFVNQYKILGQVDIGRDTIYYLY
jgi:diaminohydroxyphosphoribosylaminopyrimidine deaminase/5-amino-6-(5-phosphoribosylamino)uracil reductase